MTIELCAKFGARFAHRHIRRYTDIQTTQATTKLEESVRGFPDTPHLLVLKYHACDNY